MDNIDHSPTVDFVKEIEKSTDLLALPESVAKIIELTASNEINIDEISKVIGTDPALTGRLLRIANSPFYGLSHRVSNANQAIMVLGLTTVKCLILSAAIFHPENYHGNSDIDIKSLYGNIITIAVTSRKLAVACGFDAPEEAFTCGLLHDVGALYLMHHYGLMYSKVLNKARNSGNLIDEEKSVFGSSHPEIGGLITRKWKLPQDVVDAVVNHDNCGGGESSKLDDIIRLAVALNREAFYLSDQYIESKITKISVISKRLGVSRQQLDDITATIMKDALEFARLLEVDIGDYEQILTRANQEIFHTYMSLQKLFKERQELTNRILEEERSRGLLEAKHIAVSTLAHYINNASMSISGQAQVIRLFLKTKSPEELIASLPKFLDTIDSAIKRTVAVLDELSDMNMLEEMEYFNQSKILNIDERIKKRLEYLEKSNGLVLPEEAENTNS